MNKEQVKQVVNEKVAEILAAVDSLEESSSPSEEVEQLRLELQAEKDKNVALQAKVDEQSALLAKSDSLAKEIDAAIPDAPQA